MKSDYLPPDSNHRREITLISFYQKLFEGMVINPDRDTSNRGHRHDALSKGGR